MSIYSHFTLKEGQDTLDIESVITGMNVEETKYMIQKLLNMTVSQVRHLS